MNIVIEHIYVYIYIYSKKSLHKIRILAQKKNVLHKRKQGNITLKKENNTTTLSNTYALQKWKNNLYTQN